MSDGLGVRWLLRYAWETGRTTKVTHDTIWSCLCLYCDGSAVPVPDDFRYVIRFLDVEEEMR